MNELLQIMCELTSHRSYATKPNIQLSFEAQEMSPEILVKVMQHKGKTGWLSFLPGEATIKPEDVLNLPEIAVDPGRKSKAVILRNCLYRLWEQETKGGTTILDSDLHYFNHMNKFIDHVKGKLEPVE